MPRTKALADVREATPAQVAQVLAHTHALWGGDQPLDAYRARTNALLDTPWGRANYRFVVGLDAKGAVLTACKRYHLALTVNGAPVATVGFGAVFTPEAHRGHGHAAELLRVVMAHEQTRGTRLALLYTDIGPGYYEQLGFQPVACEVAEAPAAPGAVPFEPLGDRPALSLLTWHTPADPALGFAPAPSYWAYKLERNRPELLIYAPNGVAQGFVALQSGPKGLFVEEAGFAPASEGPAFWAAVRALAASRGVPAVRGWLPRSAEAAGFGFTPLTTAEPMLASLAGDRVPGAAQLWANDHF
jgi:GNAT superfamily N-acetyltransferase